MCMGANVFNVILLRREGVVRWQMQRSLEYCLSCMSANQSEPDIVLLDKTCDRNGQRAPVDDRETKRSARGTQSYKWLRDRVALQTWRASAHHIQQWKKNSGPTVCSSKQKKKRAGALAVL
jgi:hypothetical protein